MTILDIAILIFVVMELSNVLVMYFKPDFKYANSMAVFKQWAESQQDEKQRLFVKYLVNWVANCKLIFIALLLVVVVFCQRTSKDLCRCGNDCVHCNVLRLITFNHTQT